MRQKGNIQLIVFGVVVVLLLVSVFVFSLSGKNTESVNNTDEERNSKEQQVQDLIPSMSPVSKSTNFEDIEKDINQTTIVAEDFSDL